VVPPSGKVIGAPELLNLVDASLDGWLTTGRFNDQFEARLAKFLGVSCVSTVNSGRRRTWWPFPRSPRRSSESARSSRATRSSPSPPISDHRQSCAALRRSTVFVDAHIPTYNIDPDRIEEAVSSRTRAIMLAHTLGNPYNLDVVTRIARKHNLWLVEDCCDALGARYDGKLVGTFGHIGTLSFYPATRSPWAKAAPYSPTMQN